MNGPGILEHELELAAGMLEQHRPVGLVLDLAHRLLLEAAEEIALLRQHLRDAEAELGRR